MWFASRIGSVSHARTAPLEALEPRRLFAAAAAPVISVGDLAVTEGNDGARDALVTVSLSAASNKPVSVNFRTEDGTALAGADYRTISGTVTFAPGQRTANVAVPVLGDRAGEPNESFSVRLSAPKNGKLGDGHGVVTITDDEPRVRISDVAVLEGACRCNGATPFSFTVTLSAAY